LLSPNETALKRLAPDFITAQERFPIWPARKQGEYKLGTASARLTLERSEYVLNLRFARVKDGQELHRKIRTGEIQPAADYEARQPGALSQRLARTSLRKASGPTGIMRPPVKKAKRRIVCIGVRV
jgi:hypothetical protein